MSKKEKKLLFSVTRGDCDWHYLRGSGSGGQKKNKTHSAVRCVHRASGAMGYAEDTRSQAKNRQLAFTRMAHTKKFKDWHSLEVARRTGQLEALEDEVNRQMSKIKVEIKKDGKWVPDDEFHN